MFRLFTPRRRWRVHICATTLDQRPYLDALTGWLRREGHTILAAPDAPLAGRIAAARGCEICLLILGPEHGACEPHASFSATELEAYAALEGGASKLLSFAQPNVDAGDSVEQRDFIARLRDFTGGAFQATVASPAALPAEIKLALTRLEEAERATGDLGRAVMISSTGDLVDERVRLRMMLTALRHPVIDYQTAASETATPIERVTGWAGQCRALLLILGRRYGFVSPVDGLGVTELEFVTALGSGRPVLALLRPDALTTDDVDQRHFVERVRHLLEPERVKVCATLDDLEREARVGLKGLLASAGKPAALPAIPEERGQAWYARQVQRWLGTLPHARNPAGMPLDTMASLLVREPISFEALLATTEHNMAHIANETLSGVEAITPDAALATNPRLIVAGPAGSGKSVILAWYAVHAGERIPILVSLAAYARARRAGRVASLLDYAEVEERRMLLAAPGDPSRWRAALTEGRGLLLLDNWSALDPADRETIAGDIVACAGVLPRATAMVVAQREQPATALDGFTPQYVLPLLQAQLEEITRAWIIAARKVEEMTDRDARALFQTVTFQARGLSDYTNWARSPQMLTALITVLDAGGLRSLRMLAGAGSMMMRRALRIILTLDRRPRHLWEKERLLLEVARRALSEEPRKTLRDETLRVAWAAIAPGASASVEDVLRDLSPLIARDQGAWGYAQEILGAVYTASALAAEPEASRLDQVVRRRLHTDWNSVPALLASELDRLGRPAEGDAVVGALLEGDTAQVAGSGYPDPFHIALYTAINSQGARATEYARAGHGPELARRMGRLLREQLAAGGSELYGVTDTTWSLLLLGPAASVVLDDVVASRDAPMGYARMILGSLAMGGDQRAREAIDSWDASQPAATKEYFANVETQVGQLRAQLRDNDDQARKWAAMDICAFGPWAAPAVPELIALLTDEDWLTRQYAARALKGVGPASAVAADKLLDLTLHDPVANVEQAAREALLRIQGAATPAMAAQAAPGLRAEDYQMAQRAARTVQALGPVAAPYAPDLIWQGLYGKDGLATLVAGTALPALGPAAVTQACDAIKAAIHGDDWRPQGQAFDLVKGMKASAAELLETLRACAADPSYSKRSDAIMTLGYLGEAALPALDDLRAYLDDPKTRTFALTAVWSLGPVARPLLDSVLALLDDPDYRIRVNVHYGLRAMQVPVTPRIESALLRGMDDENAFVFSAAALAASALRPVTTGVATALMRLHYTTRDDPEKMVRFNLRRLELALWDAGGLTG